MWLTGDFGEVEQRGRVLVDQKAKETESGDFGSQTLLSLNCLTGEGQKASEITLPVLHLLLSNIFK